MAHRSRTISTLQFGILVAAVYIKQATCFVPRPSSQVWPKTSPQSTQLYSSVSTSNAAIQRQKPQTYFGDATLSTSSFRELYSRNITYPDLEFLDEETASERIQHQMGIDDDLPLPSWLTTRLDELGYNYPTLIQQRALDTLLLEHDSGNLPNVILQAQTGSGKTLSYLLPTLIQLDASRSAIQGIIIVPTRELGLQVSRVAKRLAAASSPKTSAKGKIMVMSVLQGSQNKRQRAWAWAEPPHLVIGTPNEILNMVSKGGMRTNSVKVVVVDEVDACLTQNTITSKNSKQSYSNALHTILSRHLSPTYEEGEGNTEITMNTPLSNSVISSAMVNVNDMGGIEAGTRKKHRQTIFASATIPQHHHFIQQCIQNQWITNTNLKTSRSSSSNNGDDDALPPPIHIQVTPGELIPPVLDHGYIVCSQTSKKMAGLRRFIKRLVAKQKDTSQNGSNKCKILIFCEEQRPMEEMASVLAKDFNGIVWNEKYSQSQKSKNKYAPKPSSLETQTSQHPQTKGHAMNAIVSVLRMEDSLSGRATAMDAFRGESNDWSNTQNQRDNLDPFHNPNNDLEIRIMLSTDLAARGLDVTDVTHVINFDLPNDGDTYVHRGGRAGRMGREGRVVSFITHGQEFVLERLVNKLGLQIKCLGRQKIQSSSKKKE